MATARFTREVRIPASPLAVWSVLATPSQQSAVEPRVRLISEWGEPGTLGSGYELAMRGRPTTRLTVIDALPGERHTTVIDWDGRTRGSQDAHLRPDGTGCIVTYAVSLDVPLLLRPVQSPFGGKQLSRWLDAVARVSAALGERQS